MTQQKVSVLIPCFNAQDTIETAVLSVLNGTFLPVEILIYDDASTDGSAAILREMAATHELVHVLWGDKNKGAGHARTSLLAEAKGTFIAFLDADDWWYEDKLARQLALQAQTDADIVSCDYDICDDNGQMIGCRRPPRHIGRWMMHFTNWLPTSMTIVRASLVGARQMPDIRRRQDYAYWLGLFAQNKGVKCVVVPQVCGGYRRRTGSLSSGRWQNLKANYAMFYDLLHYPMIISGFWVFWNGLIAMIRRKG